MIVISLLELYFDTLLVLPGDNITHKSFDASDLAGDSLVTAYEELRRAHVSSGQLVEASRIPVCPDSVSPRVRL